jgi:integrase
MEQTRKGNAMARLTTQQCHQSIAAAGPSVKKIADGGGLYLFVKNGRAYWTWQFRNGDGWSSKGFGAFPSVTPKAAREAAEAYRVALRSGTVMAPAVKPRQARAAVTGKTFAEVVPQWLGARGNAWKPKGIAERRGMVQGDHALSLATMDIAQITQADVLTALANETPRQHANKRGWLADLFSFAKVQGWRTGDNPARFDKDMLRGFAKVEKKKHHAAVEWTELPGVFAALPDTVAGNAVRFTALTVARAGEVEGATWKEIVSDNGNSAWVIPAERMKAGKAHRVPLTPQALALLGARGADDAPLFTLVSNAMLNALKKTKPGSTVHGLRATFKTWASENDKDRELTERSLAHDFGSKVENAYQRSDLFDRRRALMEEWSAFVAGQ